MAYAPGNQFDVSFVTEGATGAAVDADVLPVATLRRNGVDDGTVTVAVTNNAGAGDYTASATIPSTYVIGDDIELIVAATIAGITSRGMVTLGKLGYASPGAISTDSSSIYVDNE